MGFKVKGRISHKPNETRRYSQNLVGGWWKREKPTERATAKERKNQRIIMRI